MNTLIYVDSSPLLAIATKLVGSTITQARGESGQVGLKLFASAALSSQESRQVQRDLALFLPEDLMYEVFPLITDRFENLDAAKTRLTTGPDHGFRPGAVVSVGGVLRRSRDRKEGDHGELEEVEFHGESALAAGLQSDELRLPVYCPRPARQQLEAQLGEPVELTGILRWVPPYSPGGSSSWNLALRVVAVWLR